MDTFNSKWELAEWRYEKVEETGSDTGLPRMFPKDWWRSEDD